MPDTPLSLLNRIFGYPAFRGDQAAIVDTIVAGGDALVLMPTGGGKSLCYQIPALLREGCAVVVSPLIALMQDQVAALKELGIAAEFLNSSQEGATAAQVETHFVSGQLKLLYVAPERLLTPRFRGVRAACTGIRIPQGTAARFRSSVISGGSGILGSGMKSARRGGVDEYELGRLLGRGGMGEVHIARDRAGRFVAIKKVRKTLSLDPVLCERLSLEARLLGRIDHPNVVRVLDGGVANGQPFMVMSRAFGTPLDAVLAECSPLSRERITGITSQLFAGLIAIHAAGVVHADLKSSNILIDELDRVTIIDFGLARIAHDPLSDDEIFGGTPAYMSPSCSPATRRPSRATSTPPASCCTSCSPARRRCRDRCPPS